MKFYGLHWIANDGTPMQVRIETRTLQCWARSCPRGGEWTAWRRLDTERNADGTLDETCMNAIHARLADTCKKLARTCSIYLSGAITGVGTLDGSGDVHIITSLSEAGDDNHVDAIAALEQRVAALEKQAPDNKEIDELRKKIDSVQSEVTAMRPYVYGHDDGH